MLKKDVRVLRLRAVTRVRIHDQLSIGQTFSQQESVDRQDNDIPVSVPNQSGMIDFAKHREAVARGYDAPFANRRYLGQGGLPGHWRITVGTAALQPLHTYGSRPPVRSAIIRKARS